MKNYNNMEKSFCYKYYKTPLEIIRWVQRLKICLATKSRDTQNNCVGKKIAENEFFRGNLPYAYL